MKLGRFYVPEMRFNPTGLEDIKKVNDHAKNKAMIGSNEMAAILGYAEPKSGAYYRRSTSLIHYGLVEYDNISFRVTELGKEIPYVQDDKRRLQLYKEAILHVELWKELYERFSNNLPSNFTAHLKNIAAVDYKEADKYQNVVKKWYLQDIASISESEGELLTTDVQNIQTVKQNSYSSDQSIINRPMSQKLESTIPRIVDTGVLALNIDNQLFNIPIFNKASLHVAIGTLNMLAEKYSISIKTEDVVQTETEEQNKKDNEPRIAS
jgi:hypothetical protein